MAVTTLIDSTGGKYPALLRVTSTPRAFTLDPNHQYWIKHLGYDDTKTASNDQIFGKGVISPTQPPTFQNNTTLDLNADTTEEVNKFVLFSADWIPTGPGWNDVVLVSSSGTVLVEIIQAGSPLFGKF